MVRSADTVFRSQSSAPFAFEDLSERSALKLTSLLRVTAPRFFRLLAEEVVGPAFFNESGQFAPIYSLDMSVTDVPLAFGADLEVEIEIRLAKQVNPDGSVRRLLTESLARVFGRAARGGARVAVGENLKICIFSRNHPDPAQRRVTELHPSMGFGTLPQRALTPVRGAELLAAAPPYQRQGPECHDPQPHVWSYQQTDANRHVHGMDYVRTLELFAADQLALRGRLPQHYLFHRARVVFRKPCFCGDLYRRSGAHFSGPDGDLFAAGIYPLAAEGRAAQSEPAVAIQLHLRDL